MSRGWWWIHDDDLQFNEDMEHEARVMDNELRGLIQDIHNKMVLKKKLEELDHFEEEKDLFEV